MTTFLIILAVSFLMICLETLAVGFTIHMAFLCERAESRLSKILFALGVILGLALIITILIYPMTLLERTLT